MTARRVAGWAARLLVAAILVAAAGWLAMSRPTVRVAEAAASRPLVGVVAGPAIHLPGTDRIFYPDYDGSGWRALQITDVCSAALPVASVLLVGALTLVVARFRPLRVLLGALTGAAVLFAVNVVRIAVIAGATRRWGADGFAVSHRVIGTGIALAGLAIAFLALFRSAARPGRRAPRLP